MNKDFFKRSIVFTIFLVFLIYLWYLFIKWKDIVTSEYANRNIPMFIILIMLCLYIIWLYWICPTHIIYIKFPKSIAFVVWLFFIIISQKILANDGYSHIYIWDLFSVLWVITLILIPTNLVRTETAKKKIEQEDEIIIEV